MQKKKKKKRRRKIIRKTFRANEQPQLGNVLFIYLKVEYRELFQLN